MTYSKRQILLLIIPGLVLLTAALLLWPDSTAKAQCGSLASGCKSCHELVGEDPVNNDGTAWHGPHAFGDFCYLCHAGNSQSMVADFAHEGMVPPLSDVKTACQSCHPDDYTELAQGYAATLGVTLGEGAPPAAGGSETTDTGEAVDQPAVAPPEAGSVVVNPEEVVDYQQRYDEMALGIRPMNTGNLILVGMIVVITVGGGTFIYLTERKRGELPIFRSKPAVVKAAEAELVEIEGIPAEVVRLLPKIARLDPKGLHALQRLLENPESASELFHSLSRLDPELVSRVRSLDRASRELLLAMAGE